VEAIYAGSEDERWAAIERWGVTHVVVGPEERTAYGHRVSVRFAGWPAVFFAPMWQVYANPGRPPFPGLPDAYLPEGGP
jgi:hypothetical protein